MNIHDIQTDAAGSYFYEKPPECEWCGKDLSTRTNCEQYRIVVRSEPIPAGDGTVTAMHIEPEFFRDIHFCNWKCMATWFAQSRQRVLDKFSSTPSQSK